MTWRREYEEQGNLNYPCVCVCVVQRKQIYGLFLHAGKSSAEFQFLSDFWIFNF